MKSDVGAGLRKKKIRARYVAGRKNGEKPFGLSAAWRRWLRRRREVKCSAKRDKGRKRWVRADGLISEIKRFAESNPQ